MLGSITNIQRFSIHDGPGIRTTIFFQSCPLSCLWCQNPEAMDECKKVLFFHNKCISCKTCIQACPEKCFSYNKKIIFDSNNCTRCGLCIENCHVDALKWSSNKMDIGEVLKEIIKDKVYYEASGGGITFSGGEPLNQFDFCLRLANKLKEKNIHIAIDTSGYVESKKLEKINPFVDLYLYDIKFIEGELHKKYTGESNELILTNFKNLCKANKEIIVRVPLVPDITDTKKNLNEINDFVKKCRKDVKIQHIPFNNLFSQKFEMIGRKSEILGHIT